MSEKINILADTNSLIHLSEVEIEVQGNSDRWLWNYFNVHKLKAIDEELQRNIKRKGRKVFRKVTGRKYRREAEEYHCKQIDLIETKVISHYYTKSLGSDDRGERHLIGHAIAGVRTGKFGYCIVLTDDSTAVTKFIEKIKSDFIFGDIWNVFDLILYLYLTKNAVSFQSAENAIRTLVPLSSISAKKYKKDGMTESDARIQMLSDYIGKLRKVASLKSII